MAVRPLVMFPDPRLAHVAAPVTVFDQNLAALVADLLDTLRAAGGIGITAPHIGVPVRLVVIVRPDESAPRIYANPKILWASAETERHREGSIAMPGMSEELARPARLRVAYQDLAGVPRSEEAQGFWAACHQHEIDQLDGIFWLQRLSRLKRERLVKRYGKAG